MQMLWLPVLQDKARDRYGTAIDHCLELIRDYKIRIGKKTASASLGSPPGSVFAMW